MSLIATIGFFDGVHLGHQYLLHQLRETGLTLGLTPAVVTFREHPKLVLTGDCPPLITTTDERLALLKEYTSHLICLDFRSVQSLTAEAFMRKLKQEYEVEVLLMGYDHHFGSDRLAGIDEYIARGREAGVQVMLQEQAPEGAVSSTKIRRALLEGDMEEANRLLGHPYSLSGTVVHGRGLGRQLGFPTANILTSPYKLIPAAGVYLTEVSGPLTVNRSPLAAITNIGKNPTVGNAETTIETHIPDFSGDLYDEHLTLTFLRRIRPEQRFPSLDALRTQIAQDIQSCKIS